MGKLKTGAKKESKKIKQKRGFKIMAKFTKVIVSSKSKKINPDVEKAYMDLQKSGVEVRFLAPNHYTDNQKIEFAKKGFVYLPTCKSLKMI